MRGLLGLDRVLLGTGQRRGQELLRRHPPRLYQRRIFSSFSTDIGYRKTVSYRDRAQFM